MSLHYNFIVTIVIAIKENILFFLQAFLSATLTIKLSFYLPSLASFLSLCVSTLKLFINLNLFMLYAKHKEFIY